MKMLNKIILILFILSFSLNANSVLTKYRQTGAIALEKQLDLDLSKSEYWDDYLKDIDTSFGYIESYSSILTCDKKKSTLSIYKLNENNKFSLLKKHNAFTGKRDGDKQKEGDLKTPVGLYKITKKISKLDSFYGPLALVTSYPNIFDKFKGKNGSGIWIHGLPIDQKRDEYTKGCIAIDNENIKCLDRNIDIDTTMLIISPSKTKQNISKDTLSQILSGLYKWRYSWLYNKTQDYLSFYSPDFVREDGMKYKRFKQYKTRIFKKKEKKKIIFNNINVIPYPNTKDTFQITFKEFYTSSSFQFEGNKILMVKIDKDNSFKIFTEK